MKILLLLLASCVPVLAQSGAFWTFDSVPVDSDLTTGSELPTSGVGTFNEVHPATSLGFAQGSTFQLLTNPDDTSLSISLFGASTVENKSRGAQFNVSTVGFLDGIQIQLDFRLSQSASRYFQLQLSTDGQTFSDASGGVATVLGSHGDNTEVSFTEGGLYSHVVNTEMLDFVKGITYTIPAGSNFIGCQNFAIRWVAAHAPGGSVFTGSNGTYSTNGLARFDNLSISAVPEPSTSTLVLMTLGALTAVTRQRKLR